MKVAEILSDLTSLRACGHEEALALVNVHKSKTNTKSDNLQSDAEAGNEPTRNLDLQRAEDLIELHGRVKLRHQQYAGGGLVDKDLRLAREEVVRVLRELGSV
ncbi:hypothetical protein LOZ58_004566 [Ophidiomyces ophidiicola]|nr:hypothetical protein LOZ65_003977 [Ophidiomyces ophidiicola]KAI1934663.1 hypothetical protein LOZ66_005823 [Ophidiomyces ophidiicola]KAI1959295.1 hypothetical protein LOZ58_004566 [Ophidiomyces ophidiicola]